jgi:hypothetical protein
MHYRHLKLYTSLGIKITQIHRVLTSEQEAWMKPFIDFNTQKASEFLQSLFKLKNISTFGKIVENVRNRKLIELVVCLTYHICTDHVYRDLESIMHEYFEISYYPKDLFFHSRKKF